MLQWEFTRTESLKINSNSSTNSQSDQEKSSAKTITKKILTITSSQWRMLPWKFRNKLSQRESHTDYFWTIQSILLLWEDLHGVQMVHSCWLLVHGIRTYLKTSARREKCPKMIDFSTLFMVSSRTVSISLVSCYLESRLTPLALSSVLSCCSLLKRVTMIKLQLL